MRRLRKRVVKERFGGMRAEAEMIKRRKKKVRIQGGRKNKTMKSADSELSAQICRNKEKG